MFENTGLWCWFFFIIIQNLPFITYPGAIDCLGNLSELYCSSELDSEYFHRLFQICHNIQYLDIFIESDISSGFTDLISVQQNLKHLTISFYNYLIDENLIEITSLLTKIPKNLIGLNINGMGCCEGHIIPLSFLNEFKSLQKFNIFLEHEDFFKYSRKLRHIITRGQI